MKLNFLKYGAYVLIVALSVANTLCASQEVGPVEGGLYRTKSKSYVVNRADSIKKRFLAEQAAHKAELSESDNESSSSNGSRNGHLKFSNVPPHVVLYAEPDLTDAGSEPKKVKQKPKSRSNTRRTPRPPVVSYDLERITRSQAYQDFVGAIEEVQAELMDITQALVPTKTRSQKRKFTDLISNDDLTEISAGALFKEIKLICTNREGHKIGKGKFRSVMSAQKKMVIDMFDAYKIKLKEGRDIPQNQDYFNRYDSLKAEFSSAVDNFVLSGSFTH